MTMLGGDGPRRISKHQHIRMRSTEPNPRFGLPKMGLASNNSTEMRLEQGPNPPPNFESSGGA